MTEASPQDTFSDGAMAEAGAKVVGTRRMTQLIVDKARELASDPD